MKKNKLPYILLILLFFIFSCNKKVVEEVVDESKPVKVIKLEQNQISLGYTGTAEIESLEEIPYVATASGTVTVVNAKNGDYVRAGQVIVAIENKTIVSNTQYSSSNFEAARINYEKYKQLYEKRLVTETEYLQAKNTYDAASASLTSANETLTKTAIRANLSGVVSDLNIKKYTEVAGGTPLFTLIDDSKMTINIGVPAETINKIKVGSTVKVKIDDIGEEIEGKITEIPAAASTSTRHFVVKIEIPNPEKKLKKGMYGVATIDTGIEEGLSVPKEAIVIKGLDRVIFIEKNGKAKLVKIKIVNQNDEIAIIEAEGLSAGDNLIISGQNLVQEDESIKIVK